MIEPPGPGARRGHGRWYGYAALLVLAAGLAWWYYKASAPVEEAIPFVEGPLEDPGLLGLVSALRQEPTGTLSVLVVFAQFADERDKGEAPPGYATRLFDPDLPGSFTHFYDTMSFGQLQVRGTVLPKRYTSSQPAAAYVARPGAEYGGYGDLGRDILEQVDADVDLGQFDNDGPDGIPNSGDDDTAVDFVFLNLRSAPPGLIVGSATGIAGLGGFYRSADPSADGRRSIAVIGRRYHGALLREGTFAQTAGVMVHEFGHALGLPDLYDVDILADPDLDPADDSAGIGKWGLMGMGAHGWTGVDGPSPMCPWSREQLGWLGRGNQRLVEVPALGADLPLTDVDAGGVVYKLFLEEASADIAPEEREYLLLECRTPTSHAYNRQLPGGVLVWHIRPRAVDNRDEAHKLVDLVCADGLFQDAGYPLGQVADPRQGGDNLDFWSHDADYRSARGGNTGDTTDVFDGVRRHLLALYPTLDATDPLVIRVHGNGTREPMTASVSPPHGAATAVALGGADRPEATAVRLLPNQPNPFNPQTTIRYVLPAAAPVRVTVFNSLGQLVRTLEDDEQPAGAHDLLWDSRDEDGRAVASGVYHCRLEVEGSSPQVLAMAVLR